MSKRPTLTSEAGAPATDNQNAQTAGPTGPVLLQGHHLIEKLARFNRERIPERVVHTVGTGARKGAEITVPTYYRWRKEYGGLKLDQAVFRPRCVHRARAGCSRKFRRGV